MTETFQKLEEEFFKIHYKTTLEDWDKSGSFA